MIRLAFCLPTCVRAATQTVVAICLAASVARSVCIYAILENADGPVEPADDLPTDAYSPFMGVPPCVLFCVKRVAYMKSCLWCCLDGLPFARGYMQPCRVCIWHVNGRVRLHLLCVTLARESVPPT